MKKNGFTLTELLAVIVIIALLMVLIVPAAMKMSKKVKKKAFDTKIDLIKSAAKSFGENYMTFVMKGDDMIVTSRTGYKCVIPTNDTDDVTYGASVTGETAYPCVKIMVKDLAENEEINYDVENGCDGYNSCDEDLYGKQVQDLDNNYIINQCNVYLYYKNKRVYSYFDKKNCKDKKETPIEGHEYAPLKKN